MGVYGGWAFVVRGLRWVGVWVFGFCGGYIFVFLFEIAHYVTQEVRKKESWACRDA